MIRTLSLIITIAGIFLSVNGWAGDCIPEMLPPDALAIIKPYVQELTLATKEEYTDNGAFKGSSPHREKAYQMFCSILKNRTPEGDKAVAYLLNIYVGEHSGEELVCEVINRGRRILPLVKKYSECIPLTGLEPLHEFIQGSGVLPGYAIEGINKGERCQNVD